MIKCILFFLINKTNSLQFSVHENEETEPDILKINKAYTQCLIGLLKLPNTKNEMKYLEMLVSLALISFTMIPQLAVGQSTSDNEPVTDIQIPVGRPSHGIAVNPNNDLVYAANSISGTISVINSTTNEILHSGIKVDRSHEDLALGPVPSENVAVNPNNNLVYVTNILSNTVSVINSTTNEILHSGIKVGDQPRGVAVNPNNNLVYVANSALSTISIINSTTNELLPFNITVGNEPYDVAVDPKNNLVYVTNTDSNTVSVINSTTNEILHSGIKVGDEPHGIDVNPNNNLVYLSCGADHRICVINGQNYKLSILAVEGSSIAVNPNNDLVYVASGLSDFVSVINSTTNEILHSGIKVGDGLNGIAVNPNNDLVYVASGLSDFVSALDSSKINSMGKGDRTAIIVGSHPQGVAVNPNNNLVYVTNSASDSVSVIDSTTNEILHSGIKVGKQPHGIAVNPNNNLVYVTNSASNSVSVIDSTKNELLPINITVGELPYGIAINPKNNMVYVTNRDSDSVSVIDSTKNELLPINFSVGDDPYDVAVDPKNNMVYVINDGFSPLKKGPSAVSVIDSAKNELLPVNIRVDYLPHGIAVNPNNNLVYVASGYFSSSTVSIIDPYFNQGITSCQQETESTECEVGSMFTNITVGETPHGIAVNPNNNLVYVTNTDSNTVSVINSTTNEILPINITVGDEPHGIAVNPNNNLVYVTNSASNSVSVIDSILNDFVVRASFNVKPVDSGQVICNENKIPTNEYKTIKFNSLCKAIPNSGFAFSSWVERISDSNSSVTITESIPNSNPLSNLFLPDPSNNFFNIDTSGSFVANFREAPPPIPDAIWIALFSILLGTFMPSIIRWINGWSQRRRFYKYMEEVLPSKYEEKDRQGINSEVAELYAKGKINESQHKMLKDKISEHYDQIDNLGSDV